VKGNPVCCLSRCNLQTHGAGPPPSCPLEKGKALPRVPRSEIGALKSSSIGDGHGAGPIPSRQLKEDAPTDNGSMEVRRSATVKLAPSTTPSVCLDKNVTWRWCYM
jgi:hypothetical protein